MDYPTIYDEGRLITLTDGTKIWLPLVYSPGQPLAYKMHYGMAPGALEGKTVYTFGNSGGEP